MTSNIEAVPFKPGHLDLIKIRPHEFELLDPDAVIKMTEAGAAQTWLWDGRVLAIVGWFNMFEGVINVYVIPSVYVELCPLAFVRKVKWCLTLMADSIKPLHRMQSTAWDTPEAARWMEALGFSYEGTMKQYTSNKIDYCMWARII